MTTTRQLRITSPDGSVRFNALDGLTCRALKTFAGGRPDVRCRTEAIAARLGLNVRAAELRVARLVELGLVERVRDDSLPSRRRLVIRFTVRSGRIAPGVAR